MNTSDTRIHRLVVTLLTAIAGLAAALGAAADEPGDREPVQIAWATQFSTADVHYGHLAGTVDAGGRLWLLVGRREGDSLQGPRQLELWRLDAAETDPVTAAISSGDEVHFDADRFQVMAAANAGVYLALAADEGVWLVSVPGEWARRSHTLVAAAAGSETLALIPGAGPWPTVVTNRGVLVHDAAKDRWHTAWRQPPESFLLGGVAAGEGRIAVLAGSLDEGTTGLSVTLLELAGTEATNLQTTELAPGGGDAVWSRIAARADGSFAVATPLGPPGDSRWRVSELDPELNLQAAREVDLVASNLTRTQILHWRDRLLLAAIETGTMDTALFAVPAQGPARRLQVPSQTKDSWHKTSRVSVYGAGGTASYLVISGQVAEPDFSRLRASLKIMRLK